MILLVITHLISVQQRLKTLTEFRTMSVAPFPIPVLRDSKWSVLQSDELLPGDVISLGTCPVFTTRSPTRSDPIQPAVTSQKLIFPRTYS